METSTAFKTGGYSTENNGTIIKSSTVSNNSGSWVRQYEGHINVLFFGAFGVGNNYTANLQKAIDFASLNTETNPTLKSSIVYLPNGSYVISNIVLKSGVTILGESIDKTIIYSPGGTIGDYLFKIESGPVFLNMSNLNLVGNNTEKGCFLFESKKPTTAPFHGGLWNSRISDIKISAFRGHGVYLKGGELDYLIPNQFNILKMLELKNQVILVLHYT